MSKWPTPYYAVIFTSVLNENTEGYTEMARKMEALANAQPGFLGMDSARETIGITVSYWDSLEAIDQWKNNMNHKKAKNLGKTSWYKSYDLKIAKIEL